MPSIAPAQFQMPGALADMKPAAILLYSSIVLGYDMSKSEQLFIASTTIHTLGRTSL
jgi:hypothetical protein